MRNIKISTFLLAVIISIPVAADEQRTSCSDSFDCKAEAETFRVDVRVRGLYMLLRSFDNNVLTIEDSGYARKVYNAQHNHCELKLANHSLRFKANGKVTLSGTDCNVIEPAPRAANDDYVPILPEASAVLIPPNYEDAIHDPDFDGPYEYPNPEIGIRGPPGRIQQLPTVVPPP